jgi:hypothetical protein
MRQIRTYCDDRLIGCAFCDGDVETRDHVPPRVLLDEPYPENLPVVPSCRPCNSGHSLDEEYAACLLEVTACGSANPGDLSRAKVARTLRVKPDLAARLAAHLVPGGLEVTRTDVARLERVLEKIGRALWWFETGEPTSGISTNVRWAAIASMSEGELQAFLQPTTPTLLPEVGSRMLFRVAETETDSFTSPWQLVQRARFSYAVDVTGSGGCVKMLIAGYLATQVELAHARPAAIDTGAQGQVSSAS